MRYGKQVNRISCTAVSNVITAVLLLACAASSNAQGQTGTIVFYREPHASTNYFKPMMFCDGVEIARIESGTYFQLTAPSGPHTCMAESLQRPTLEIDVLAGQSVYVHEGIQPGLKKHATLANTSESEFNKQKVRLKPLKEWSRDTLRPARAAIVEETPAVDNTDPPAISDSDAGTPPKAALRVFLTRRKAWLVSGGFTANQVTAATQPAYFANDFHKRCPNFVITDVQDTADYAVTIDEIGFVDALTGSPNDPTFRVAVYSRSAGLLYTGGTSLLKNAVKDACNAIGVK